MKAGSHLGALGALINNVEHFIQKDGNIAPTKPAKTTDNPKEVNNKIIVQAQMESRKEDVDENVSENGPTHLWWEENISYIYITLRTNIFCTVN